MLEHSLCRRRFLTCMGAAACCPLPIAAGALGAPAPSDRVATGHIGVGGRGATLLDLMCNSAAAVCDVDAERRARAAGGGLAACEDYRRLLDRKDIDAVVIATPDHWHALMTVHACQAGKDVYVESPAARTIDEGRAMVDAARRARRVVQVGAQGIWTSAAQAARRCLRSGAIGAVEKVTCWHYPNPIGGHAGACAPPAGLNWNLWLGPAARVPYHPDRCHFNFRWLLDFGGGHLCGRGARMMSLPLWCLDRDGAAPARVTAQGAPPPRGLWDCPPALDVAYEFKNPRFDLVWSQPGEPAADAPYGVNFRGSRGTLVLAGGESDGGSAEATAAHIEDWLACIRTRRTPAVPIATGQAAAALGAMGILAYRLGRPLAAPAPA